MKELVIANWKMNPQTYAEAERLFRSVLRKVRGLKEAEVVICPPFVWLTDMSHKYKKEIGFGAQDVSAEEVVSGGAFTGEVSAKMLVSSGVKYVIVGHSERRAMGETDELINKKIKTALAAGLKVILCVGEPKRESGSRNNELRKAKTYVKNQLKKDLKGIRAPGFKVRDSLIIAYEPVWAISSRSGGRSDTPEDALEMVRFIKETLASLFSIHDSRVLYGGSVNSKNARGFLSPKEIGGALVGRASLDPSEFEKIIKAAK